MKEIWKEVKDLPRYEVSNLGRIRNKYTSKLLKGGTNNDGYIVVGLRKQESKNVTTKHYKLVHRLVAETFIPNDDKSKTLVNHRDENPSNNRVDNLEWCTPNYNVNYGTRNEKISVIVVGTNIINNSSYIFKSYKIAADFIRCSRCSIANVIKGGYNKSIKGFIFRLATNKESEYLKSKNRDITPLI